MTWWKSKIRVVIGVISSTESESDESERFHSFRFRLRLRRFYDTVKTRLSKSEVVAEDPTNYKAGPESNIVICLFFLFCLRPWQCSFYLIVRHGDTRGISILFLTPSVWFSLDRNALRFCLRLRVWLCRQWKQAFTKLRKKIVSISQTLIE